MPDAWGLLPELARETFRVRAIRATEQEAREYASTLSLAGIAGKIMAQQLVAAR